MEPWEWTVLGLLALGSVLARGLARRADQADREAREREAQWSRARWPDNRDSPE